jgi:hypothetical protein
MINVNEKNPFKMRTVVIISILAIVFMSSNTAHCQSASYYNLKLNEYGKIERKGKGLTIAGGIVALTGAAALSVGLIEYSKTGESGWGAGPAFIGGTVGSAGLILMIPGAIYWGIGSSKVKRLRLEMEMTKTGFYYNPLSTGITIAFRF